MVVLSELCVPDSSGTVSAAGAGWFGLSPGWKHDRIQLVQFSDQGGVSSDAGGGRTSLLPNIRNMLKLHPAGMKKEKHDKHLNTSGDSCSSLAGKVAEGSGTSTSSVYGLFDGPSGVAGLTVLFLFFRMTLRVMHDLQLGQNRS